VKPEAFGGDVRAAQIRNQLILPAISSAILLFPVAVAFRRLGNRALFNFLADDSMYYGQIANNFIKYGFPTSDGLTPTNGFQPLWGWLLMAVFKGFHVAHSQQLLLLFGLSALCVVAAYGVLSVTFYRLFGLLSGLVATLALFPGIYPLLFEPTTRFGSDGGVLYGLGPWSAMNGVESPLVLLTWSLLFCCLAKRYVTLTVAAEPGNARLTDYFPPAARWCLAAILLCRLEQGLVFIAIAAASLLVPAKSQMERLRDLIIVALPATAVLLIYVCFNMLTVGVPLPVSGLAKVQSGLVGNFEYLLSVMSGGLRDEWWLIAVRIYPLIFGGCAGIAILVAAGRVERQRSSPDNRWHKAMSVYLVSFGLFLLMNASLLFAFEPIYKIGYWYYWPIVLIPATLVALWLGSWTRGATGRAVSALAVCCAVLLFRLPNELHFLDSTSVAHVFKFSEHQDVSYQVWTYRAEIRADILRRYPDAKLVDPYDGIFGFALDLPARSFSGLISSPAELKRRREVGFWRSAVEDGFDILPDFGYFMLQDIGGTGIDVVDKFRPPSSPIDFYRIRLR
jgi:hypothetical protein